jgi:hypothetical protein
MSAEREGMIEEILSMQRCCIKDFGYLPEHLIIGQDQFNRLLKEIYDNGGLFFKRGESKRFLGAVGELAGLVVIVVTSDILEVV